MMGACRRLAVADCTGWVEPATVTFHVKPCKAGHSVDVAWRGQAGLTDRGMILSGALAPLLLFCLDADSAARRMPPADVSPS